MRQPGRNSCRPFGTSGDSSTCTTGSRPWLHLVVPAGLNHILTNHVDYVLPMFSLVKILHGVALWGFDHLSTNSWGVAPGFQLSPLCCFPALIDKHSVLERQSGDKSPHSKCLSHVSRPVQAFVDDARAQGQATASANFRTHRFKV